MGWQHNAITSINGSKALHHGGKAVAGADGCMLGGHGLWVTPGQGRESIQCLHGCMYIAILHQAAVGHPLQNLLIGVQAAR